MRPNYFLNLFSKWRHGSGLRTWANETIRERLEAVEKDLPGPLEEIEIYLRSEGVDRTAAKKTSAV